MMDCEHQGEIGEPEGETQWQEFGVELGCKGMPLEGLLMME